MMQKFCPGCRKYSYSAYAEGQWICPYCGENITKEPAEADPPVFAKIPAAQGTREYRRLGITKTGSKRDALK